MSNDYRVLQTRHAYRFDPRPEGPETYLASEIRAELRGELRTAPRHAHRPESPETHLATETPKRTSYRKPRGETPTANRHVLRHAYRLENPQRLPATAPRLVSVPAGVRFGSRCGFRPGCRTGHVCTLRNPTRLQERLPTRKRGAGRGTMNYLRDRCL